MKKQDLIAQIKAKQSFLCIGLDTDIDKLPKHFRGMEDPVFEFNKQIIDATQHVTVAYKPNTAFYECRGVKGWRSLQRTITYLNEKYPEVLTIADAKRGDIGNTSEMYAKAFFEEMDFNAVTIAPYMGADSVTPFLKYENKWVILLALTSNQGAFDFQFKQIGDSMLYKEVLKTSQKWGTDQNMMYVVGATKAEHLEEIRKIVPNHFLLVPGVGAQGGSLEEVAKFGMNSECGLLVNSSRGILYASSNDEDYAEKAKAAAEELQQQMVKLLPF